MSAEPRFLADVTHLGWRVTARPDNTAATVTFTHNGTLFKTARWTLQAVHTLLTPDRLPEILTRLETGTTIGDAQHHTAHTHRCARCTCGEPGDICPTHQALIDAYDAEHEDDLTDAEWDAAEGGPLFNWPAVP